MLVARLALAAVCFATAAAFPFFTLVESLRLSRTYALTSWLPEEPVSNAQANSGLQQTPPSLSLGRRS